MQIPIKIKDNLQGTLHELFQSVWYSDTGYQD